MQHFKLVFHAERGKPCKSIEFDALDAAAALIHAHKESADRSAELWSGDRKLCSIRRVPVSETDIWQIKTAVT